MEQTTNLPPPGFASFIPRAVMRDLSEWRLGVAGELLPNGV